MQTHSARNAHHYPKPQTGGPSITSILEMATGIVSAHASSTKMSKAEIIAEIKEVFTTLSSLEAGQLASNEGEPQTADQPAISKKKAFGKDKVYCMICGKGFVTLKKHLTAAHEMTVKEYKEKFDIATDVPLVAKSYSEQKKRLAVERGLGSKN